MCDVRVIPTTDVLRDAHAGQQNFQFFVVAVSYLSHRSVLNTRKSLSAPQS